MKKIGQKEILQAIINEALTIKRKKEIFKEARKLNAELKQLNEGGHPGAMLGYGFSDYKGPSPVLGLSTPSQYENGTPEEDCGCKLDEFPKLEKDMEDIDGGEETLSSNEDDVESLKAKNAELEQKLMQIQNAIGELNESWFDKAKAGFQGLKAGIKTGVEVGKQAGQQQYQQTQQAQEKKAKLDSVKAQLNQAKANAIQSGEVDFNAIQKILAQAGYKFIGGKMQTLQPLSENETCGATEGLEEGIGGFLKGVGKKIGGDIKGAAQNVAGKVQQYASDVKSAGQEASAQQNQMNADKEDAHAKEQSRLSSIASEYDKIINLVNQL